MDKAAIYLDSGCLSVGGLYMSFSVPFNLGGGIFKIEHYFYTQKYTSNYYVSLQFYKFGAMCVWTGQA